MDSENKKPDGLGSSPVAPVRSGEPDMNRRDFLRRLGAALSLVAVGGLAGCEGEAPKPPAPVAAPVEVEPKRPSINFLGHTIEILDEARFKEMHDKALQHLLLKFSSPKLKEVNEVYWKRAIEEDFREVLLRMGRYETMIQSHAESIGLDPDVLAYFGIEAGFNPLKRSPTGFCGLGQIGTDAVRDTAKVLKRQHADEEVKDDEEVKSNIDINPKEMNDWYDLRYDPMYGALYGLGYLKHLGDQFPATIQRLLDKYSGSIKTWLETEVDTATHQTRLDTFEKRLNVNSTPGTSYPDRYKSIASKIIPSEAVKIADPQGFAIHSYNMGAAGVARLVFANFLEAKIEGKDLVNEEGISSFSLNTVTSFDMDMGHGLRTTDSEATKTERQTYLWQAFVYKELMDQWHALEPDGTLPIEFKGTTYSLVKPQTPVSDYIEELSKETIALEVPVGVDLVKFAEHLGMDHEALRLVGRNAKFIRAGAYKGNPKSKEHQSGSVEIGVPMEKATLARSYIQNSPTKVNLYTVRRGDTANAIFRRVQKTHPSMTFEDIFWNYNRIGWNAAAKLDQGEILALPSEVSL